MTKGLEHLARSYRFQAQAYAAEAEYHFARGGKVSLIAHCRLMADNYTDLANETDAEAQKEAA